MAELMRGAMLRDNKYYGSTRQNSVNGHDGLAKEYLCDG